MPKPHAAFVLLLTLGAVAACAPGQDLPPLPPDSDAAFHLGPGDEVRIIAFGDTTLTNNYQVSDSGDIAIPLLGPVQAGGLTPEQLQTEIADGLKAKQLFNAPSVSVEVLHYRPFFVLGEVNKPGEYPYHPGMTVLTAVAIAGGFTYRAVEDYASVTRAVAGQSVESKAKRETLLDPGDTVTIFERRF